MHPKIEIVDLPVTEGFARRRRLIQDRGELALIEDGLPMGHLAFFTLLPGKGYRGGHLHRVKTERFYVARGRGRIDLADPETGERFAVDIAAGRRVVIRPGLAHRFEAFEELLVLEYYEGTYDPADDVAFPEFRK